MSSSSSEELVLQIFIGEDDMGWHVVDVSSIGKSYPFLSNCILTGAVQMVILARSDMAFLKRLLWYFARALN